MFLYDPHLNPFASYLQAEESGPKDPEDFKKNLKSMDQVDMLKEFSKFALFDNKEMGIIDNSSRLFILSAFTEKNLDNINGMLLDVQAQMI